MATRVDRLNEELQKAISEVLTTQIKDPRLQKLCTVTRVQATPDLKLAKVFISIYDDEAGIREAMRSLKNAAGFIGARTGELVQLRRIPQLTFVRDDSIAEGVRISALIDRVNAANGKDNQL